MNCEPETRSSGLRDEGAVAIDTVPISACFREGWNSEGKKRWEGPLIKPQMEEPPSEAGESGPIGSPVWKEKDFWMP